jgi:hypothetical protein
MFCGCASNVAAFLCAIPFCPLRCLQDPPKGAVVRLAATIAIEGSDPNTALLAVEQDGILLAIDFPPELVGFPDDVTTTCSPEGGGPAALPPVANVTAADPNDEAFHPNTTFSEQQVSQCHRNCALWSTAATFLHRNYRVDLLVWFVTCTVTSRSPARDTCVMLFVNTASGAALQLHRRCMVQTSYWPWRYCIVFPL